MDRPNRFLKPVFKIYVNLYCLMAKHVNPHSCSSIYFKNFVSDVGTNSKLYRIELKHSVIFNLTTFRSLYRSIRFHSNTQTYIEIPKSYFFITLTILKLFHNIKVIVFATTLRFSVAFRIPSEMKS